MSVANPVIDYIDPDVSPRLIYLRSGVREYHPIDDIYHEVRNLRRTDESLRSYDMYVFGGGAVNKNQAGTSKTPRYAIFNYTQIVPADESHDLSITGEQLYADELGGEPVGQGSDAIDKTPLSAGVDVNIDYAPPEAEVLVVEVDGGSIEAIARCPTLTNMTLKQNVISISARQNKMRASIDGSLTMKAEQNAMKASTKGTLRIRHAC